MKNLAQFLLAYVCLGDERNGVLFRPKSWAGTGRALFIRDGALKVFKGDKKEYVPSDEDLTQEWEFVSRGLWRAERYVGVFEPKWTCMDDHGLLAFTFDGVHGSCFAFRLIDGEKVAGREFGVAVLEHETIVGLKEGVVRVREAFRGASFLFVMKVNSDLSLKSSRAWTKTCPSRLPSSGYYIDRNNYGHEAIVSFVRRLIESRAEVGKAECKHFSMLCRCELERLWALVSDSVREHLFHEQNVMALNWKWPVGLQDIDGAVDEKKYVLAVRLFEKKVADAKPSEAV